ncbi:hypothetical protein GCM10028802_39700 [Terrabacter terrigena]
MTAQERLRATHPPARTGSEDEPSHVSGAPVHRCCVWGALQVTHMVNLPAEHTAVAAKPS